LSHQPLQNKDNICPVFFGGKNFLLFSCCVL
jgi:hypothetical protein